jgi:DNA polymerase
MVEIRACQPWLEAEIEVLKPALIVCQGATAAQALLGREFRITRQRGVFFEHNLANYVMATVHPSALLRAPDPERRRQEYRLFVKDLAAIPKKIAAMGPRA